MTDYKPSNNNESESVLDFHAEEEEVFNAKDYRFEDWIALILFWLLAFTVMAQFVSRYIFQAPLGWTEEVARYQLVCLGFIGGCMGVRRNTHIFVALFHRWMPQKISQAIYRMIAIFNVIFLMLLAFFAYQIIPLIHIHQMASLPIPVSGLYGIVLAGILIMVFRSIGHLISFWKNGIESEEITKEVS